MYRVSPLLETVGSLYRDSLWRISNNNDVNRMQCMIVYVQCASIYHLCVPNLKSARTVGAKGRVFPEALTQSALAGGGGPFFCR